jgi:hypothetical protein
MEIVANGVVHRQPLMALRVNGGALYADDVVWMDLGDAVIARVAIVSSDGRAVVAAHEADAPLVLGPGDTLRVTAGPLGYVRLE